MRHKRLMITNQKGDEISYRELNLWNYFCELKRKSPKKRGKKRHVLKEGWKKKLEERRLNWTEQEAKK